MPHLRIKPFPAPVNGQYATDTWQILRTAVEDILQKKMTSISFEQLYQHAYGMFLHKHGSLLHDSLREVITQHLETRVRTEILKSLETHFLQGLKQVWDDYSASMSVIKDIFMYMDRKVESMDGDHPSVYSMGLNLFRDNVLHYGQVRAKLQQTLIEMISMERRGEAIDQPTIKSVCTMLMELGAGARNVYEEDFEAVFLADSVNYCRAEAQRYLDSDNAGNYIRNVERLVQAETDRINQYLDKSTKVNVDKIIDEELIQKNMGKVVNLQNGGAVSLIQARNFSEMLSMFKLINRVPEGVTTMLAPISACLKQQGTALMSETSPVTKNPVQLIQAVMDLKKEYDTFLEKSFKKDQRFRKMIATDFEHFFNMNKRAPELLSHFIDEQLKNGSKNVTEQQMNTTLEQAMTLFRYLHEKDVFERFYKHHLARRLLAARTTSDESEKAMLSKLRHECGYSYTSKLEGMYRDVIVSATFNEKFKDHCFQAESPPIFIDLSVQILTTGFWPMPPTGNSILIPENAMKAFSEFRRLYLDTYNGRQLNLQSNLGTAEVSAEFYGPPASSDRASSAGGSPTAPVSSGTVRKHTLSVTTHQMCVLMLFNQQPEWSYQDIQAATGIPDKDCKRTMATLSTGKMRILLKLGNGKFTESTTRFIVNDSFYSQLHRVKINAGTKMDFKEEVPDEEMKDAARDQKFEADRRHEVDAAIIRILKGRQQMDHNELLAELISQLRHRFTPTPDVVKKCIDGLIAKDYIQRAEENKSLYRYVA